MCRWPAYPGTPIKLEKLGMETTNGAAFGVGAIAIHRHPHHRDVDRPAVCRVLPCCC
jgi:hypothetical protein